MKWILIGHRGTGKTSLLHRLKEYFPEAKTYDLDEEIARQAGTNLVDFFKKNGEVTFRKLELDTLQSLLRESGPLIIASGAGLELEKLKTDAEIIWVRRYTDQLGRIFLDRPRLQKELSPIAEYMSRYRERNLHYQKFATDVVDISEGFDFSSDFEKNFFKNNFRLDTWAVSLQPYHFRSPESLERYLKRRLPTNLSIELRDDLLTNEQIHLALPLIPKEQVLISFRKRNISTDLLKHAKEQVLKTDWDLSLGNPDYEPYIVSLHDAESLEDAITKMQPYTKSIQKISLETDTYSDLVKGDIWLRNQEGRAFLPRSKNGKYKWYRLYRSDSQAIQFLADHTSSSPDQPAILEVLRQQGFNKPDRFAAVLGLPVEHSLSPASHYEFFKPYNIPFYAIPLDTWALHELLALGLQAAAITSPYKEEAYRLCHKHSDEAKEVKSVNTLWRNKDDLVGFNTDVFGLKPCLDYAKKPVVVWGGGGLLSSIQKHLPDAYYYSSRTGAAKTKVADEDPQTLIWAVGRKRFEEEGTYPPPLWQPTLVIDMNYTEDSPGKTYAQGLQAEYISGMTLFKEQAKKQQEIWHNELKSEVEKK